MHMNILSLCLYYDLYGSDLHNLLRNMLWIASYLIHYVLRKQNSNKTRGPMLGDVSRYDSMDWKQALKDGKSYLVKHQIASV